MDRHGGRVAIAVAPHVAQDLLTLERPSGVAHQEHQQLELAGREGHQFARPMGLATSDIDLEVAVGQPRWRAWDRSGEGTRGPAQHRLDPRRELLGRERLGDVVIGTELESGHPVGLVTASRQHDHWHRRGRPELTAHLETTQTRKHQVEHDEVRRRGQRAIERNLAVGDPLDLVALLLQVPRDNVGDVRIVVDHEHALATFEHPLSVRARLFSWAVPGRISCFVRSRVAVHHFVSLKTALDGYHGPMFDDMHVLVMAKEPIAGQVKTRLCPPCDPHEAASLAEAALADTLDAAEASGAERVVLALDGRPGVWCPAGVEIVSQVEGPFDRRLAAAWQAADGPGVQIGMDTPQVTAADLDRAIASLVDEGNDATLGLAEDGGWWIIGLRRPDARVFDGVPMSHPDTGVRQLQRLRELGLRCGVEPTFRDVDEIADAIAVAALAPNTRFGATMRAISDKWSSPVGAGPQ